MSCPSCKSDDYKMASLVHKEGLSRVDTLKTGPGAIQSTLSEQAAPPNASVMTTILLTIAFIFGVIGVFVSVFLKEFSLLLYGGCAISFVGMIIFARIEGPKQKVATAAWQATRVCLRCGTFYVPKP